MIFPESKASPLQNGAQRWLSQWINGGKITAIAEGRARHYFVAMPELASTTTERDRFPSYISLSPDSRDIVAYMDLPPEAREPVTTNRISLTKCSRTVTANQDATATSEAARRQRGTGPPASSLLGSWSSRGHGLSSAVRQPRFNNVKLRSGTGGAAAVRRSINFRLDFAQWGSAAFVDGLPASGK